MCGYTYPYLTLPERQDKPRTVGRTMVHDSGIGTLTALAQDSRLAIYRLLVKEEPLGLPVGEISKRLDIVPSTLSGHLGLLKRAGKLMFFVQPNRWIAERTQAWFRRNRHLVTDSKRIARKFLAFIRLATIKIMLRRLART